MYKVEKVNIDWHPTTQRIEIETGWIYRFEDWPNGADFPLAQYLFVPKGDK